MRNDIVMLADSGTIKPALWLALVTGLSAAYLFILGGNTLAAALSYMRRTRQQEFPLGRCILAAAGPSAVPVCLPIALGWWGYSGDAGFLALCVCWYLSFWGSARLERRLPGSRIMGGGDGETRRDPPGNDAPSDLTNVQFGALMILGVIKAWLALAVGVASGYGAGAAASWLTGLPFHPPTWTRMATGGPVWVLMWYGILGFLVEILRLQGGPRDRPGLAGWSAARKLRFRLLACIAVAAVYIGIYASLWW